jgi:hypothetical protein
MHHSLSVSTQIFHVFPGYVTVYLHKFCVPQKCRKIEKSSSRPPSSMKSIVAQEASLKNGSFVVAPVSWNQKYFIYSPILLISFSRRACSLVVVVP